MVDWWSETDDAILECLRSTGAMSPGELGGRVGISESEAIAFLCMLARQGRVCIRLVALNDEPATELSATPPGTTATVGFSSISRAC